MNELIYKQDAIDLVKEVCDAIMSGCDSHYDPETEDEVYNDLLEVDAILKCNKEIRIALANLSSAQPRQKGKWIERDDCWDGIYYECSVCKDAFTLMDGTPSDNNYNFCPNCGADMREGEEE